MTVVMFLLRMSRQRASISPAFDSSVRGQRIRLLPISVSVIVGRGTAGQAMRKASCRVECRFLSSVVNSSASRPRDAFQADDDVDLHLHRPSGQNRADSCARRVGLAEDFE